MLTLTKDAAAAIRHMLAGFDLPDDGGLRISAELDEQKQPGLHLSFAAEPEAGDQTVSAHGANVFLDASAAEALEEKVLDAQAHGDHSHFSVSDR
jgi:iron-sulfur cluster assembly protein